MEFYTLTSKFVKDVVLDEFQSGIWTERYSKPGDVTLVLPATRERVKQLAEGTLLSVNDSKEVVLIDTQVIEDGMLTVTGNTLEKFLDERIIRHGEYAFPAGTYPDPYNYNGFQEVSVWHLKDTPAKVMAQIVQDMIISPSSGNNYFFGDFFSAYQYGVNGAMAPDLNTSIVRINSLTLGPIYNGGELGPDNLPLKVSISLNMGEPIHTALLNIAEAHSLGMGIYLEYLPDSIYYGERWDTLRFTVYKGVDRTRRQTKYSLVRFSPDLDSFTNVKELRSLEGYKTEVLVALPNGVSAQRLTPILVRAYENYGVQNSNYRTPNGFENRVGFITTKRVTDAMIKKAFGEYVSNERFPTRFEHDTTGLKQFLEGDLEEKAKIRNIMYEEGREYLTENHRKRVIDGETVPQDYYRYGKDYKLGDLVEVESYTGKIEPVRVVEYIRTHDETGERAYPTFAPLVADNPDNANNSDGN